MLCLGFYLSIDPSTDLSPFVFVSIARGILRKVTNTRVPFAPIFQNRYKRAVTDVYLVLNVTCDGAETVQNGVLWLTFI